MNGKHAILFLCVCIVLQMLGVAAPLLDAASSFDIVESSIQEGWSIHTLTPPLPFFSGFVLAADRCLSVCVPILAGTVFRPPLA
ncbi:MAG TPA: hypothetical protein VLA47_01000 [Nitrospira sp.]|nr:hypothetical protein [Nitrospira sp.]